MAVTGWPTDAGAGQVATEDRWVQMAHLWTPEGVVDGVTGELAPSFAAGQVTVQTGAAWINGHYATNDAPVVVPTAANGLVVLRYTVAGNVFAIAFNSGATVPTQTAAVWEIPLALVTGGAMTDQQRMVTADGPRGMVGWAQRPGGDFSNTAAPADVSPLSITWLADPSRRYRIQAYLRCYLGAGTPPLTVTAQIHDGAGIIQIGSYTPYATNARSALSPMIVQTGLTGLQTRTVRFGMSSGTGTAVLESGATHPATFTVEDVGPA